MRNSVLFVILLVAITLTSCKTQRVVQGPQGKIATTLRMPRGVDGRCFGIFRLGRDYLTQTQQLDIYGTSADYQGPVCLIHGTKDRIVPIRCSRKYDEIYQHSQLYLVDGETHTMRKKIDETTEIINRFLDE